MRSASRSSPTWRRLAGPCAACAAGGLLVPGGSCASRCPCGGSSVLGSGSSCDSAPSGSESGDDVQDEDHQYQRKGGAPCASDEPVLRLAHVVEDLGGEGVHSLI